MAGTYIALCGSGQAGKDTFFTLLHSHLNDRVCTRIAFADALKRELDPLFKAFGGTAFETDPVKKNLQRPVLISHGCSRRVINPNHWIEQVDTSVREALGRGETAICTDTRFRNECEYARSLGGKTVYIERRLPDGSILPPISHEEEEQDPYLRANADVFVSWPTILTEKDGGSGSIHDLWIFVEKAAKELNLIA